MRKALVLLLSVALISGAVAAEGESADKASGPAAPGNNVDMPPLIAPVLVEGRLVGYFYISSRLKTASSGSTSAIREKIAFIQDLFVRDVNANPFLDSDPAKLDRAELGKRLLADARKIIGASTIVGITFGDGDKDIGVKYSPLRVEDTPSVAPVPDLPPIAEAQPAPPQESH